MRTVRDKRKHSQNIINEGSEDELYNQQTSPSPHSKRN